MQDQSFSGYGLLASAMATTLQEDISENARRGVPVQAAVAQLRESYLPVLNCNRNRLVFTLSVAIAAWKNGVLYPSLQRDALAMIGTCLKEPQAPNEPALTASQRAELRRIAEQLHAPQRPRPNSAWAVAWSKLAQVLGIGQRAGSKSVAKHAH